MAHRKLLIPLLILQLLFFWGCKEEKSQLPNIVIIFVDDQGYSDLGCYGARGFETPNIDRMADEGIKFTSFYVSEAVCSASRASLLTGCYAQRISIRGALNPIAFTGLHPEETTIASLLRSRGYKTGIVGKWHLGHRLEFLPANFGFDEYYGLPYSNDMWPVGYDGLPDTSGYKGLYPPLNLIRDSIPVKGINNLRDQDELSTLYTQEAIDFIYRNQDDPFFLYLPHSMVHVPLGVSRKFRGQSEQGLYGDVMMEIDWSVGEVMRALEETGNQNNTIIIYASDNGPWLNFGNHGGSADPLREGKGTAWEGGVRVPCIVKWPENITPGRVSEEIFTSMDLLPTLAALTGAPLPDKKIDGLDASGMLLTDSIKSPRDEFYYFYEGTLRGIRKDKWKLMLPHRSRTYEGVQPGSDGFPGPQPPKEVPMALYNLQEDIGEKVDVSLQYPEKVAELQQLADSVRQILGDGITGVKGSEVRPCGRIVGIDSVSHLGVNKDIELAFSPAPRYSSGGPLALVDGLVGSMDFLDGRWLGFRDNDLELVVDMDTLTTITSINLRFLQNQVSWIFLPGEIIISVSDNGVDYNMLHKETFDSEQKDLKIRIARYNYNSDVKTRFIKVQAKRIGSCPDWHPGKGEKAWMFMDEIIVK